MKNHWLEEQTEKLRPLLTLITDKIVRRGLSMGAHHNRNWCTNKTYDYEWCSDDTQRPQGVLDRIGKVKYHKCFHTDHRDLANWGCGWKKISDDLFDHAVYCEWRELFGKGYEEGGSLMEQDAKGRWHYACDKGMHITLWHPTSQTRQEAYSADFWEGNRAPHWRPEYHYTEEEVEAALKIMCHTFDWEYERTNDGGYSYIS